jgi:hypothetical protein
MILASDNRVMEAIPSEDIKASKSNLIKMLNYKQLPFSGEELFVVAFNVRVTKTTGKKMANIVVADASRDLKSIVVFPMQFAKAYMKIEEGKAYNLELGQAKDGTITLANILEDANV